MSFGLEVDGRVFSTGSSYSLVRTVTVNLVWGAGIYAPSYSADIRVEQDEFFSIGDTGGVFVYSTYTGGMLRLVSRQAVSFKVFIYGASKVSAGGGFGLEVYDGSNVQFTTKSAMLMVKDFKPYSLAIDDVDNPPVTYSFKPKVVCLTNSPWNISSGASSINLFNAYSISGNTLRTAVARESRQSGQGAFDGFIYDKRAPYVPYGVTR